MLGPPSDSYEIKGKLERLAPGGEGRLVKWYMQNSGNRGAWRLAACVPRQAIWRRVSPGGLEVVPGDNAEIKPLICLLWMCVVYKALVISRRSACWCSWVVAWNVSL